MVLISLKLTNTLDIEWSLKRIGAVDSEMEEDPREKQRNQNRKKMSSYVNRYSDWSDDEEDQ